MNEDLVYIDEYNLLGSNFYWNKYESKGLTKEDILRTGLKNDRVQVHREIIDSLVKIDKEFKEKLGYRLYIKEGYRSKDLYEIVYKKRVKKFGKEDTDKLLNMKDMPHASGKTVDIALWDKAINKEVYMRNGDDGIDALFIDYYKNKDDDRSKHYQSLQQTVLEIMRKNGFELGIRNEYFHFNYSD